MVDTGAIWIVMVPSIVFILIAIVFNGIVGSSGIAQDINTLNCPMPSASGLWNSSGTLMYANMTYNYANVNSKIQTLTCTSVHTADGIDYNYGQPLVALGIFFFGGDWLSEGVYKLGAVAHLIGLNLYVPSAIPANIANTIEYVVYVPLYIMLGLGLYLVFHPTK